MKEVIEPIFPSDLFDWNTDTKIAVSSIEKIWNRLKEDPKNKNKRIVLDIDGKMWIKSVETNDMITCQIQYIGSGKVPDQYGFEVIDAKNKDMIDWKILIKLNLDEQVTEE